MSKKYILLLVTIFVVFIFINKSIFAEGKSEDRVLVLSDEVEEEDLYRGLMLLSDNDREYETEDILAGQYDHLFLKPEEFPTKPGFFPIAKWIKFEVENTSEDKDWMIEFAFPLIYKLNIYAETDTGYEELVSAGADLPYEEREIDHRNFVFDLDVAIGETETFYAVVHGGADLHPSILLWEKNAFLEHSMTEYIVLGLFYGMLIIMIVYNLFLYIILRIRAYLYYVFVMITAMIAQLSLNGLAFKYLWPNFPEWNVMAVPFWVGISCAFVILFTREFLDTDKHIPRFRYISYGLIGLHSLMIVFLFIEHYIALNLMFLATFSTFTAAIIVTYMSIRRGVREARFLFVGWFIFLAGVFITILERAVVLPHSVYTEYAGQGALALQVALLSMALADKINIIREEKSQAEEMARDSQSMALESLKKADELKDEFLAITSHELRTPLFGMVGIAESLRDGAAGTVPKEVARQLEMIIISGKRLTHLVNDILDFSKLKHESISIDLKRVNLFWLVDIVFTVCHPLLKGKNVELINNVSKDDFVVADPNRLQQIMYNLVGNAIEFTEYGEVTVTTEQEEEELRICVSDTGSGIAFEKQEGIFEPFKQVDSSSSRQIGGTGIGLNVTRQLVELHGGRLEVESELGVGSTFSFKLKEIAEVEDAELEEVTAVAEPGLNQERRSPASIAPTKIMAKQQGIKVLVVDDEPVNLQVLMNQLSLEGVEVIEASCGDEVFGLVEKHNFDVLILDIMMPNMSGFEVCERLRRDYSLTELPILMLTAKNQVQDKITAFEVGANDYLTKPCEKEELLSRVETLAQMRRLNSDLSELNTRLEEIVKERTKALEEANIDLSETNETLIEVAESRRNLLANVAHELGTPVTLIHSYIQSIQDGIVSREDEFYRRLVDDKINVLSRLIDDLFELSKLEAGSTSLNLKTRDLFDWLKLTRKKFEMDVQAYNRTFEVDGLIFTENKYRCTIDQERMDQVFINIISNSVKNTAEEDGRISIKAELSKDEDYITISFKDNGKGISDDMLPYIFERFYKKKYTSDEEFSGTGLGLAIVKEIVEGHNGVIWAESEKGVGSIFYISLPIEKVYESLEEAAT